MIIVELLLLLFSQIYFLNNFIHYLIDFIIKLIIF